MFWACPGKKPKKQKQQSVSICVQKTFVLASADLTELY